MFDTFFRNVFDPTPLLLEAWGFHPGPTTKHSQISVLLSSPTSAPIQSHHTRPSVNPLYSKCEIKFADNIKLSNFLFAHDSIKSNLPTAVRDIITINIPYTSRNQEANQVNIPSVRSKSANIWNYLNKLFHSEQLIHQKRSFCTSLTSYFIKGYV